MAYQAEGQIIIPMEDFWEFVGKYVPSDREAASYGVPTVTPDGIDMVIDFAVSTTCNPADWAERPECLKQWDEHKKKGHDGKPCPDHVLKTV